MTSNQIAYFKAREDVRAHKEDEYNTRVANENARRAADRNADIAERNAGTNLLNAYISAYAQEAARRTSEANWLNALTNQVNAETRRQELFETSRTNQFYEGETYRHNLESENLGYNQLFESVRQHQAQEQLGYNQLFETQRSNQEQERLKQQSLLNDTLFEEHNYDIKQGELRLKTRQQAEVERANRANENLGFIQTFATAGSSLANIAAALTRAMG